MHELNIFPGVYGPCVIIFIDPAFELTFTITVKSRLSERRLSETTGLFEDDGQSRLFSLLSIAIKLPIIRISIIRKIQFFEVIRRSRLKKLLLKYPSRFQVQVRHVDHYFFVWSSSIYTPE